MRHPFDLSLNELKAIDSEIDLNTNLDFDETLSDSEADQIGGGSVYTTLALGEEGGDEFYPDPYPDRRPRFPRRPSPKPIPITPIDPPITTHAWGEEGGKVTTLALGEEGGDW